MSATKKPVSATSLPWVCNQSQPGIWHIDESTFVACGLIATCWTTAPHGSEAEANARLIVRAVNAFDYLVAALKAAEPYTHTNGAVRQQVIAALAKASDPSSSPDPRWANHDASAESARAPTPGRGACLPAGAIPPAPAGLGGRSDE